MINIHENKKIELLFYQLDCGIFYQLLQLKFAIIIIIIIKMSQSNTEFSIYIPTLRKQYRVEYIIYLFWVFGLGNVDRVDFVPIMKSKNDAADQEEGELPELVEDTKFRQAFLYIRRNTEWAAELVKAIEEHGSYRFYPYKVARENITGNPNEYWAIRKNTNPIPYATTELNIHQLANNNTLLEARIAELEDKNKLLEELIEMSVSCIKEDEDEEYEEQEEDDEDDDSFQMPRIPDIEYVTKTCQQCNQEHSILSTSVYCVDCSFENLNKMGIYTEPYTPRVYHTDEEVEEVDAETYRREEYSKRDGGYGGNDGRYFGRADDGGYGGNDGGYFGRADGESESGDEEAAYYDEEDGDISSSIDVVRTISTCSDCGQEKIIIAYDYTKLNYNMCEECVTNLGNGLSSNRY